MSIRKKICLLAALLASSAAWAQNPNASPRALAVSNAYLEANARALGLTNADGELRLRGSSVDGQNNSHIRYDQFYKGVKVFEGEAIGHVTPDGDVTLTNGVRGNINLEVNPGVARGPALEVAVRALGIRGSYDAFYGALEILPRGSRSLADMLVWHFRIFVENDTDLTAQWDAFVDARNGALLWYFDSLETAAKGGASSQPATATGDTMYSGARTLSVTRSNTGVYTLQDPLRAGSQVVTMKNTTTGKTASLTSTTGVFGDFLKITSDPNTAGADAHFGMQATWDYLKTAFGRNGLDGLGKPVTLRVHYGAGYGDAFWMGGACYCATFGDGNGIGTYPIVYSGDIGHELAHGLMESEANLTYAGESGGLNESNSDILGEMVRFSVYGYPIDSTDWWVFPAQNVKNYDSSGNYVPWRAWRYLDNPPLGNGAPSACWSTGTGSLEVHIAGLPNSHAFYLLAHGGTSVCNGQVVAGIGNTDAARIWYDAVTNWMTASTDYHGARTAALNAAAAKFGAGSAQYSAVAAAYSAINVN
jgi:Zn-dependent metalloprotease